MLKKILLALAVVLVVFVAFVAQRPAQYHVERTLRMGAPTAVVFDQVDDFRKWNQWSPWAKLDPNMTTTYAGPARGVGASYAWQGNDEVGQGRMTITDHTPNTRVVIKLEFIEPFASLAMTTFTFAPEGQAATSTTWAMDGNNDFMGRLFCLFMDMDKMIGKDFEKGLAQMKLAAEADAKQRAAAEAAAAQAAGAAGRQVAPPAAAPAAPAAP